MIRLITPLNLFLLVLLAAVTVSGFALIAPGTELPIHYGLSGAADRHMTRDGALLILPGVTLVIWGLFWVIGRYGNQERGAAGAAALNVAIPAITVLMLLIQAATVLNATGHEVNTVQVIAGGLGLLGIVLGNVMPKTQPNHWAGIRIRATLDNPDIWLAVHRLVGALMMIGGVLLVVAALLVPVGPWLFAAILVCWGGPLIAGLVHANRLARR